MWDPPPQQPPPSGAEFLKGALGPPVAVLGPGCGGRRPQSGGGGGGHDAVVGFSVCSRRRQWAHRHLRCPSLPFPRMKVNQSSGGGGGLLGLGYLNRRPPHEPRCDDVGTRVGQHRHWHGAGHRLRDPPPGGASKGQVWARH